VAVLESNLGDFLMSFGWWWCTFKSFAIFSTFMEKFWKIIFGS